MDDRSKTTTYPYMEVNEDDATITHEATVGRINEDQLFYLMSRGLSETQALSMIVTGFMEPFTRVLPMEVCGRVQPAHRDGNGRRRRLSFQRKTF